MYYKNDKKDYFVKNCRSKNMIFCKQLNVTLIKIFEIKQLKKINDEAEILKINFNNDYYIINNKIKLKEAIAAASNKIKKLNSKIEKFKRSFTSYSEILRKGLGYNNTWNKVIIDVLNKAIENFETLINNSKKKEEQLLQKKLLTSWKRI